jgi:hypothetical protein
MNKVCIPQQKTPLLGDIDLPLEWAKAHCPSYITLGYDAKTDEYEFYFADGFEALLFRLKWQ